jgi:hypothetical protein
MAWDRFLKTPDIQYTEHRARPWKLKSKLLYLSDVPEIVEKWQSVIEVPAGYQTDFASVPRIPLVYTRYGGKGVLPSIIHDWLYSHGDEISRKAADQVFLEAMDEVKDPAWKSTRWMMYAGVRVGGWMPWRKYRKHGAPEGTYGV